MGIIPPPPTPPELSSETIYTDIATGIADDNGNVALGIDKFGNTIIGNTELDGQSSFDFAIVDNDYKVLTRFDNATGFSIFGQGSRTAINSTRYYTVEAFNNTLQIYSTLITTGVKTKLTTLGNNWGISASDNRVIFETDRSGYQQTYTMGIDGTDIRPLTSLTNIACWGDSLTANSYPSRLATLFSPSERVVYNDGISGTGSSHIAQRMGAITLTATVAGNSIPATITPVNIALSGDIYNTNGTPVKTIHPREFTIAGVPGWISWNVSANSYQFTRLTAGTAVTTTANTTATPNILDRDTWTTVIWAGANNAHSNPEGCKADIDAMVAFLKPFIKRFVVMSILMRDTETAGTTAHTNKMIVNDYLSATYPNNFVDIRLYLLNQYNPSIPQDVTDFNNGITPSSLRTDFIHLTTTGYQLVAQQVYNFITSKGW